MDPGRKVGNPGGAKMWDWYSAWPTRPQIRDLWVWTLTQVSGWGRCQLSGCSGMSPVHHPVLEAGPGGQVLTLHLLLRVEFVKMASECDAVNLGQGFPDFPPPDFAVEAFQHALSSDFMLNQYTRAFVSLPAPSRAPGHRSQGSPRGGRGRAQGIECGPSSVFTECLLCSRPWDSSRSGERQTKNYEPGPYGLVGKADQNKQTKAENRQLIRCDRGGWDTVGAERRQGNLGRSGKPSWRR